MVKIKDIAIACGTSSATVSKALHNSKELSKKTIEKIQKVAHEMGYVPNQYARALKMKRSYSIGVIFYDPTHGGLRHEYFSSVIDSLKTEAEQQGYGITFLSKSPKMPTDSYVSLARYWNMDGVIIVSEDFEDPDIIELANSGMPVVTIDYIFNSCTAVLSDNAKGMEKLMDYVIAKGHKKIAFIHGELTDVTKKRLASYYQCLKTYHIPFNADYVRQGIFHGPKEAGRATKALLDLKDRPTCICYPDDVSMLGGITAIQQRGLKIGEDISVVGYDGVELSKLFRPRFTTYCQNGAELGKQAALALIDRIENPDVFYPDIRYVEGSVQEGDTVQDLSKK